jgi:hypothetical protein
MLKRTAERRQTELRKQIQQQTAARTQTEKENFYAENFLQIHTNHLPDPN